LDTYMDALKDIPEIEESVQTKRGVAKLQKTDIFRKIMWFGYDDENTWYPVEASRVAEILKLNKSGIKPDTLLEDQLFVDTKEPEAINSDLIAMDKRFSKKKKNKKKRKKFPNNNEPNVSEK
jgi:hypothetical protein